MFLYLVNYLHAKANAKKFELMVFLVDCEQEMLYFLNPFFFLLVDTGSTSRKNDRSGALELFVGRPFVFRRMELQPLFLPPSIQPEVNARSINKRPRWMEVCASSLLKAKVNIGADNLQVLV